MLSLLSDYLLPTLVVVFLVRHIRIGPGLGPRAARRRAQRIHRGIRTDFPVRIRRDDALARPWALTAVTVDPYRGSIRTADPRLPGDLNVTIMRGHERDSVDWAGWAELVDATPPAVICLRRDDLAVIRCALS